MISVVDDDSGDDLAFDDEEKSIYIWDDVWESVCVCDSNSRRWWREIDLIFDLSYVLVFSPEAKLMIYDDDDDGALITREMRYIFFNSCILFFFLYILGKR